MSKKNLITESQPFKKVIKELKSKTSAKVKTPKFKLMSYTMKAVIPVGQYANIQPEITVQAVSMEAAERAVMPYIETLFAKYRDGGVKPIEPVVTRPVAPVVSKVVDPNASKVVDPNNTKVPVTAAEMSATSRAAEITAQAPIPLTVPFNRAKGAIESCTSYEALKLVADQIEKSTKLIDAEKVELRKLITIKTNDITIAKGV